jgi:hypothetical protein
MGYGALYAMTFGAKLMPQLFVTNSITAHLVHWLILKLSLAKGLALLTSMMFNVLGLRITFYSATSILSITVCTQKMQELDVLKYLLLSVHLWLH